MRRRIVAMGAALGLLGTVMVVTATPAASGTSMIVTVTKSVVGTAPGGATFTLHYDCPGASPVTSGDKFFGPTGNFTSGSPINAPTFGMGTDGVTCTITETTANGESGVISTCAVTAGPATCGTGANSNQVTWDGPSSAQVAMKVVNTFFPPVTVNPVPAVPKGQASVSGTLCTKAVHGGSVAVGAPVQVTIGFPTPLVLNTTAAGTTGDWTVNFTVPAGAKGAYSVTAVCGDPVPYPIASLSVLAATAAFTG
jgi:hypothetical protein